MDTGVIIGLVAISIAVLSGILLFFYFFSPKQPANMRSMMAGTAVGLGADETRGKGGKPQDLEQEFNKVKQSSKKKAPKKTVTLQERFFHAGMFSDEEKKAFYRLRIIAPIVAVPLIALIGSYINGQMALLGAVFGLLVGIQIPFSVLDRRVKGRAEDILFYLPLVIEQIVIGVSSSLDIGPCIQRVVQMADERDSHNPVTELLRHAQLYVKSGVGFSEALMEIGKLSGNTELKHSFMSLAQVAKHGGEITKQLQELADAVANQRETKIEAKIKKLELEATGPVGLVFVGFMLILMVGFASQVMQAFG